MPKRLVLVIAAVLLAGGAGLLAYGSHLDNTFVDRFSECVKSSDESEPWWEMVPSCNSINDGRGLQVAGGALLAAGAATAVAGLVLHLRQKNASDAADPVTTRPCPACAEPIQREAKVCRFCGTDLSSSEAPAED